MSTAENRTTQTPTEGGPVPGRPLVETAQGRVLGVDQGETQAWYGIPYAAPPVGELRFRRPLPPEPWEGTLSAEVWGAAPVQPRVPEEFGGVGAEAHRAEDCLTVNVVRPTEDAEEPGSKQRPVLVWVYGGAYRIGTSHLYDGRLLAARGDAVVVTFNYRVGALGFLDLSELSTAEHRFESNAGLHDQIAALAWVRENIAAFGGDPTNVTLFGESAGAISVLALLSMPAAQGLFQRAIAQSPAPLMGNTRSQHTTNAGQFVEILARQTGRPGESPEQVAELLASAAPAELLAATDALDGAVLRDEPGRQILAPSIDGDSLPDRPLRTILQGGGAEVPLIIGTNANEGTLFRISSENGGYESIPVHPKKVEKILGSSAAVGPLLAVYPGFPGPEVAAQLGGDMVFWYPSTVTADGHSTHAPTWAYRFDYVSADPRFGAFGATHGQEIGYVFGRVRATVMREGDTAGTSRDALFSAALMDLWLTFARTGAPAPAEVWPQYTAEERGTLILDESQRVERDPQAERRRAWAAYVEA